MTQEDRTKVIGAIKVWKIKIPFVSNELKSEDIIFISFPIFAFFTEYADKLLIFSYKM